MSRRHVPSKPAPYISAADKLARRRFKRKHGPSAQRRAAIRHDKFVGPCGCVRDKHGETIKACAAHAPVEPEVPS